MPKLRDPNMENPLSQKAVGTFLLCSWNVQVQLHHSHEVGAKQDHF
jgi:hypothetical protein